VDFFFALRHWNGLAAGGRDQVDLADFSFVVLVFIPLALVFIFVCFRRPESESFSEGGLRSERKAIQRPSGDHLGSVS
jgi:hypothetical protein